MAFATRDCASRRAASRCGACAAADALRGKARKSSISANVFQNGNNVLDAQTRTAAFPASIRYFGASREHVIAFGAFLNITIRLASSCAIAEWLILRLHAAKVRRCAKPAKTPISNSLF